MILGGSNEFYALNLTGSEVQGPAYSVAGAISIRSNASSYTEDSYVVDQSANGAITTVPVVTTQSFGTTSLLNGEVALTSVNLGLPTKFNLDLWFIDLNHFVVTDWRDSVFGTPPMVAGGYLTRQSSGQPISGTFAFTETGATTAAVPQEAGGIFTCGSTGTLDVTPLGGTLITNQAITSNCISPSWGRGLITLSGAGSTGIGQFAAYPTLDQGLYLIELDGGSTGTSGPSGVGQARQQTIAAPVSASAFSGSYAWDFSSSTTMWVRRTLQV